MIDELRQSGELGVEWTIKQRLFAAAYLRHKVGSRAVREAGYDVDNPERAASIAKALLLRPHVRSHILERTRELLSRYDADANRVIDELATIAFLNPADMIRPDDDGQAVLDLRDLTDRQWKAIGQIEIDEKTTVDPTTGQNVTTKTTKLKPLDKLKALEALGRHHKLFTDKLELSGAVDIAGRIKAARDAMRAKREGNSSDDGSGQSD
jgi:phage terminase small subunit